VNPNVSGDSGSGAIFLRTIDGGETWQPIPGKRIPKPEKGEAQFAASGTCLYNYRGIKPNKME